MKMTYGYARTSCTCQNLERQILAFHEFGISDREIFTDKVSGKNFNRQSYNTLVGTKDNSAMLREGDLLVILSLDRLGRNYTEVKNQWEYITKTIKADICVLDMPLLDTRNTAGGTVDSKFISDLVLQILSYVAEKERENTLKRQRQGIDAMPFDEHGKRVSKKTNRVMGRPVTEYPCNWKEVYTSWKNSEITAVTAMKMMNLKRTTFYRLVKSYEEKNNL